MEKNRFKILFIKGNGIGAHILSYKLRKRGHRVHIKKPEMIIEKELVGYDFVLITCYSTVKLIRLTMDALAQALKGSPNAKVVLGGPGFSEQPEAYLRHYAADYGLIGEADNTISELFDAFERLGSNVNWTAIKNIDGAVLRAKNNRVYVNPTRPAVKAEEIDWTRHTFRTQDNKRIHIHAQRGCPNNCTFCTRWFGHSVRSVEVENLVVMIEKIAKNDKKEIIEVVDFDGELFLPRQKAMKLCEMMQELGLHNRFRYTADFTVNSLLDSDGKPDEEFMIALRESGFFHIGIGVESFIDVNLRMINKPQSRLQILAVIRKLFELGFEGHFYMIDMLPESRLYDQFLDSYISMLYDINPVTPWSPSHARLEILHGTAMFDKYKDDPTRFRSMFTGRVIQSNTDMTRYSKKKILCAVAVPYDPALELCQSVSDILFAMEERYRYLSSIERSSTQEGELQLLGREVKLARKAYSKLPKSDAVKCIDIEDKFRGEIVARMLREKKFMKQWHRQMGERARLIEHRIGKKLLGDNWQSTVSNEKSKREELNEEIIIQLWLDYMTGKNQLPKKMFREQIGKFFDEIFKPSEAYLFYNYLRIPRFLTEGDLKAYRKEILISMKDLGKARAVRLCLQQEDPGALFAKMIVRGQLYFDERLLELHSIKEDQDSTPYLIELVGQGKRAEKLKEAARQIP